MKLTKKTAELVCDLEYLIGTRCYQTYNAYLDEEERNYRYPVWAEVNGQEYEKFYENLKEAFTTIKAKDVKSLRYKFGNNELDIGMGIIDILDFLEERYNIDFAELEKNLKEKD